MVDRITFLKSIDQKEREYASTVVTFFDQFMALYSLIGSYDIVGVSNESDETSVSFNVNLCDKSKKEQLASIIVNSGNQLIIYDKLFKVYAKPLTDTAVSIMIC